MVLTPEDLGRVDVSLEIGKDGQLSELSAVQEVTEKYGIPVISIGNLDDLFGFLNGAGADPQLAQYKDAVAAYRTRYGIA